MLLYLLNEHCTYPGLVVAPLRMKIMVDYL